MKGENKSQTKALRLQASDVELHLINMVTTALYLPSQYKVMSGCHAVNRLRPNHEFILIIHQHILKLNSLSNEKNVHFTSF